MFKQIYKVTHIQTCLPTLGYISVDSDIFRILALPVHIHKVNTHKVNIQNFFLQNSISIIIITIIIACHPRKHATHATYSSMNTTPFLKLTSK